MKFLTFSLIVLLASTLSAEPKKKTKTKPKRNIASETVTMGGVTVSPRNLSENASCPQVVSASGLNAAQVARINALISSACQSDSAEDDISYEFLCASPDLIQLRINLYACRASCNLSTESLIIKRSDQTRVDDVMSVFFDASKKEATQKNYADALADLVYRRVIRQARQLNIDATDFTQEQARSYSANSANWNITSEGLVFNMPWDRFSELREITGIVFDWNSLRPYMRANAPSPLRAGSGNNACNSSQ